MRWFILFVFVAELSTTKIASGQSAPLTPIPANPLAVAIDELPVAAKQGANPRFALADPLGDALESAFLVMPADTEGALLMRGKHLLPPSESKPVADPPTIPPLRGTEFDLKHETEHVRVGLYYMTSSGLDEFIEPIGARMRQRDVAWVGMTIRNVVNTLAIGDSGSADSYGLIAFREPLDEPFFDSLRPQTKGVRRIRGVDVIRYEPEMVARLREQQAAIPAVAPNTIDGPAGPPNADPPSEPDDGCVFLVPLAPNALAFCETEEEAENLLTYVVEGATFSKRRPAWLTWDDSTTFVGFNAFPNRGKDAAKGTLAAEDPNARGIVIRWSQPSPQQLQFVYATDLIDPTPRFETAMKHSQVYGHAHYQPHPHGVEGTMVLGETRPGDQHPLDGSGLCLCVYHLCGMIILP